jgi:hypothetical protein
MKKTMLLLSLVMLMSLGALAVDAHGWEQQPYSYQPSYSTYSSYNEPYQPIGWEMGYGMYSMHRNYGYPMYGITY